MINQHAASAIETVYGAPLDQATPVNRLASLDVLRGIAALGVGWFHSRVDLWVGFKAIQTDHSAYSTVDRLLSYLSLPVSQMGGTVMIFFVLSGFFIHLPIASRQRMPHWSSYAMRRFMRIYPAYLVTLLICLLAALCLFQAAAKPDELNIYAASALMVQNWLHEGRQIAMNPSLWTIPVEVEAYFLYPLLYWIWRRHGVLSALGYTIVLTIISFVLFAKGYQWASTSFFKYALVWNAGAWLAEAYASNRLPRWSRLHGCFLLATPVITMLAGLANVNDFYLHYGWGIWSVLLLFWVLGPGSRFFAVDSWWMPPLIFTGTISYSYYLLHFPVFKLAGAAWDRLFDGKPESFIVPTIATFAMIPIAWTFYKLVEQPTHRLARQLSASLLSRSI
jgi:peptidoglycan/LPS O-acetylase OafA/YrhL